MFNAGQGREEENISCHQEAPTTHYALRSQCHIGYASQIGICIEICGPQGNNPFKHQSCLNCPQFQR